MGFIDTQSPSLGQQMIRRIQATPIRSTQTRPMFPKNYVFVSDCCNAHADDWFREIRRCPACKESCSFEEVG